MKNVHVALKGLTAVLISWALLAERVRAQDAIGDDDAPAWTMEDGLSRYRVDISRGDVTFFARTTGLTPEQREAALELWAAYSERHTAASELMQEYTDSLTDGDMQREWQDEKVREQLDPVQSDFNKFENRINKELTEDLRAVLTDAQEPGWKWFDQRRKVCETSGLISRSYGAKTDLALIAHQALGGTAWSDGVATTLDKYYSEVLELIDEARKDQTAATNERIAQQKAEENENEDEPEAEDKGQARLLEQRKRENVFRLRGAQLNERYAAKIAGLLPADAAERFEERYLREMSEMVPGMLADSGRAFDLSLRVADLTADQRSRLVGLRGEWSKDERRRMRGALDERIAALEKGDGASPMGMQFGIDYQERLKQQAATLKDIRGVLTPEQVEAAGPPISATALRVPNFEAEDEMEPPRKAGKGRMFNMEGFLGMRSLKDADVTFFIRVAGLDDDQRESAKDLLSSYTARQRRAVRKMAAYQEAMTERAMQGDAGDATNKAATKVYLRFGEYTERLEKETMADLRAILTDAQSAAYDRLEKRVRRRSALNAQVGMMTAGAGIDLVGLLEGVMGKAGLPAEADAILLRYEGEIAPAVDRLRDYEKEQMGKWGKMAEEEVELDAAAQMAAAQEMMAQMSKLAAEARDLNIKFFREVLPTLPEETRPEAEQTFYFAASPFSMMGMMGNDESGRRTPRGLLDEAVALGDLTEEERASLAGSVLSHAKDAAAKYREVFDKLVQAEKENPNAMERMQSMGESGIYGAEQEVSENRGKTVDAMLATLTAEQRERLPKPYRPQGSVARPRFEEE